MWLPKILAAAAATFCARVMEADMINVFVCENQTAALCTNHATGCDRRTRP
jgi:hypothetical protein